MSPTVSVCVPTWDGAPFLRESLSSVLAQGYGDFELLVVDDGSSDETLDVAASFRDPRLVVQRNRERLGIPGNWNHCLATARGRYVKFLFQDDVLVPTALERLVSALEAAPDAVLAFSRRTIQHEEPSDGLPLQGDVYHRALSAFYSSFDGQITGPELVAGALLDGRDLTVNVIGEPSFVLLRREAARAAGGFDARFAQLVDWELWLRLARHAPLAFVDESLGVFRVHGGGASARQHRSLRMPWEYVKLLGRVRRTYGPVLPAAARRRLARDEWRYLRHLAGEALRSVAAPR